MSLVLPDTPSHLYLQRTEAIKMRVSMVRYALSFGLEKAYAKMN